MPKSGRIRKIETRAGGPARVNGRLVPRSGIINSNIELETALEELRTTQEELLANRAMLEEQQAHYYELFEFAPHGYVLTDGSGRISQSNQATADLLNVPPEYVINKPMVIYVAQEARPAYWALLERLRNEQRVDAKLTLSPRHRPPIIVLATVAADPVRTTPGRSLRWIVQDITAQERANEELRKSREQLRLLAGEVARAEERERRRIAAGIHDRISQNLAMAKISLGRLSLDASPAQKPAIEQISSLLSQVIRESRSLTFELAPPVLYELGLVPALEWLAEETQRQHGLTVRVETSGKPPELPDDLRGLVFQAARELLTNTIKHARATQAKLTVLSDAHALRVIVSDDGSGFPNGQADSDEGRRGGFGLFNIRTRIEQIGGALQVLSTPGAGTRSTIVIPVEQ